MTYNLNQKLTQAEYEANREAITDALAAKDAAFIRQELGMTNWTEHHRDALGVIAECQPTQAMWDLWHRDRIQIKKLALQPVAQQRDGTFVVHCYDDVLSELLING